MPYGLSNYRRTPIGLNTAAFADVVGIIRNNSLQADQQQSAIDLALAQLPVNAAEDEWRTNLSDEIRAGGENIENPADRLAYYTKAAGNIFNRPDVIGRIRAQAEFDNFVKQTQARQDLTEDDKAWALANNPYSYKDTRDANGRIIGGTMWKASRTPQGMIDYNKILAEAKQLVFQEAGGSTDVVFHDAEGKPITNPTDITKVAGIMYTKNGQWQGIDKNKLNNILEAAIDNTPGARARLEQDWEVANWKYNQMSPEEQITNKPSELFASNGKKYTKQEWYNNKFGRPVNSMSGMNRTTSIDYDKNYSAFMQAKAASSMTSAGGVSTNTDITTGLGTPAYIETENVVNKAFGKVESGIQDLENIIPGLKNSPIWINAKNTGDYTKMSSIIKGGRAYKHLTPEERINVDQKLRDFNDNASLVNSVKSKGGDYDAIAFNGSFTTGGELPGNNKYTTSYMNMYDDFVGEGNTKLRYAFDTEVELNNFAKESGLSRSDYTIGRNDKGMPCIIMDKSNTKNYRALNIYGNSYQANPGFWSSLGSALGLNNDIYKGVVGIDDEGVHHVNHKVVQNFEITSSYIPTTQATTLKGLNDYFNIVSNKAKQVEQSLATNRIATTTKHFELPAVANLKLAGADASEIKSALNTAANNIIGMNGSQYEIASFDEDTQTLSDKNIKDRTALLNDVKSYLLENKSDLELILGTRIIDGKAGYAIQIPKVWNKSKNTFVDGDMPVTEIVIFNPNDPILKSMVDDTKFKAAVTYDRLSRINGARHTTFENDEVLFDEQGNPHINGIPATRTAAISYLDKDQAYRELRDAVTTGVQIVNNRIQMTQTFNNSISSFVKDYYGYEPGTSASSDKIVELISQMINELK